MTVLRTCAVVGTLTTVVVLLGVPIRAADVGIVAVDEPQYLLSAISLARDGDLDISDERARGVYRAFHEATLPVQTRVLDDGRRVSPHDPLLPVLLAPAVAVGGWVGAKVLLSVLAGVLAGATTYAAHARWQVPLRLAAVTSLVAGVSTPLVVYGQQVYPEVPAALAVVVAALAATAHPCRRSAVVLTLAVSALPWLAIKYAPVALALTVVALLRWRRDPLDRALVVPTALALAASGLVWLAVHRVLYGGWTAYSSGDHFVATGEFSAVGVDPDLWGRSTRLVGLLVDRDYGLVAWQPAWLLILPAVGLLLGRAGAPHRWVLLAPLAAGWLTATYLALTMHGYWWPGRQLVVVLPLAVIAVSVLLAGAGAAVRAVAAGLAAVGVLTQAWVLTAGHRGSLTWVGAPDLDPPPALAAWRALLPDYRDLDPEGWALHGVWVALALLTLALAPRLSGKEPA